MSIRVCLYGIDNEMVDKVRRMDFAIAVVLTEVYIVLSCIADGGIGGFVFCRVLSCRMVMNFYICKKKHVCEIKYEP